MGAELNGLRQQLLVTVRERGGAVDALVADALRTVPRHIFLPDLPPEAAYRDEAIVTKWDDNGMPIELVLAADDHGDHARPARGRPGPAGAGDRRGHRVQRRAARAHRRVRRGGSTSIDLDPEIVVRARGEPGRGRLRGRHGAVRATARSVTRRAAPYDRIIATVGVWDLAPAWHEQLAPGGRLVVPLDLRGVQRSVCFERAGDHWTSRSTRAVRVHADAWRRSPARNAIRAGQANPPHARPAGGPRDRRDGRARGARCARARGPHRRRRPRSPSCSTASACGSRSASRAGSHSARTAPTPGCRTRRCGRRSRGDLRHPRRLRARHAERAGRRARRRGRRRGSPTSWPPTSSRGTRRAGPARRACGSTRTRRAARPTGEFVIDKRHVRLVLSLELAAVTTGRDPDRP